MDPSSSRELPASCDQRTRFLVQIFIVHTVELLNRVSGACEEKLAQLHQRILRVDAAVSLLEAKLRSVDVVKVNASEPLSSFMSTETASTSPSFSSKSTGPSSVADDQCSQASTVQEQETDPKYAKFHKMLQVGVPEQAVKLQMSLEGVSIAALPR